VIGMILLASVALTHLLVASDLMRAVADRCERYLPKTIHTALFECYQCSGFWCGLVMSLVMGVYDLPWLFALACMSSFFADLCGWVFAYLGHD
jgi:hypothetical protein